MAFQLTALDDHEANLASDNGKQIMGNMWKMDDENGAYSQSIIQPTYYQDTAAPLNFCILSDNFSYDSFDYAEYPLNEFRASSKSSPIYSDQWSQQQSPSFEQSSQLISPFSQVLHPPRNTKMIENSTYLDSPVVTSAINVQQIQSKQEDYKQCADPQLYSSISNQLNQLKRRRIGKSSMKENKLIEKTPDEQLVANKDAAKKSRDKKFDGFMQLNAFIKFIESFMQENPEMTCRDAHAALEKITFGAGKLVCWDYKKMESGYRVRDISLGRGPRIRPNHFPVDEEPNTSEDENSELGYN